MSENEFYDYEWTHDSSDDYIDAMWAECIDQRITEKKKRMSNDYWKDTYIFIALLPETEEKS